VFENRILKKCLDLTEKKYRQRQLYKELHNLYSEDNIMVIKSMEMRCMRHVEHMGEIEMYSKFL
jgi:hypothetical protein